MPFPLYCRYIKIYIKTAEKTLATITTVVFHAWPMQVYDSMYLVPDLPLLSGHGSDALSLGRSLLLLLLVNTVVHVRIGHLLETF